MILFYWNWLLQTLGFVWEISYTVAFYQIAIKFYEETHKNTKLELPPQASKIQHGE